MQAYCCVSKLRNLLRLVRKESNYDSCEPLHVYVLLPSTNHKIASSWCMIVIHLDPQDVAFSDSRRFESFNQRVASEPLLRGGPFGAFVFLLRTKSTSHQPGWMKPDEHWEHHLPTCAKRILCVQRTERSKTTGLWL